MTTASPASPTVRPLSPAINYAPNSTEYPNAAYIFSLKNKLPFSDDKLDRFFSHATLKEAIADTCESTTSYVRTDVFSEIKLCDLVVVFEFLMKSSFVRMIGDDDPNDVTGLVNFASEGDSECFYPWHVVLTAIELRDRYGFEPLCLSRFCWYTPDWVDHLHVLKKIFHEMGCFHGGFKISMFMQGISDFFADIDFSRLVRPFCLGSDIQDKVCAIFRSPFDNIQRATLVHMLHVLHGKSAPMNGFFALSSDMLQAVVEMNKRIETSDFVPMASYRTMLSNSWPNALYTHLTTEKYNSRKDQVWKTLHDHRVFGLSVETMKSHPVFCNHITPRECVVAGDTLFTMFEGIAHQNKAKRPGVVSPADDAIDLVCTVKVARDIMRCLDGQNWKTFKPVNKEGRFHLPGELLVHIQCVDENWRDVMMHVVPTKSVYASLHQADLGAVQIAYDGITLRRSLRNVAVMMSGVDIMHGFSTGRVNKFTRDLTVVSYVQNPPPAAVIVDEVALSPDVAFMQYKQGVLTLIDKLEQEYQPPAAGRELFPARTRRSHEVVLDEDDTVKAKKVKLSEEDDNDDDDN